MAMDPTRLNGLRATVVGAAREGTALVRYLAAHGARVTLSDNKPASALSDALAAIAGLDVRLALGENPPDLLDVDVLFASPGVPPTADIIRRARDRGLPISSEPRLFTQLCAAPVVGITGSSGKTTTTSLVGRMLAADGRTTWVGGNIGRPLLERMLEDERPDVAVMELSSFQLEFFDPGYQGNEVEARRTIASRAVSLAGWSPHVAAITNITPNHLDRHPSMDDYANAKSQIVAYQRPDDWAVLNRDDPRTRALGGRAVARVLTFSLKEPVAEGAFLWGEDLVLRMDGHEWGLCRAGEIPLRGRHNVANVLTAACCGLAVGTAPEVLREAVLKFTGVAHRLEVVREVGGVTYVNDSIATSPERAIAALRSFDEPLLLLAGGRDKHLPWDAWADLALQRTTQVVVFGEAAPIIETALAEARERRDAPAAGPDVRVVAGLDEAVALAVTLAQPGQVVLLSPGGTSYDAFVDFEARGRRFCELVATL